ncbi:MAG: signal recognition particle-docking protein FtsY [Ruminococcaceae bacterium]|nr:signal recognition particle-docking protein FtsY [Oscillospiraceae bacterium]
MGLFGKIGEGLKKTRESMKEKLDSLVGSFKKIDENLLDELEETLVLSDVGGETSMRICDELRKKVKSSGVNDASQVKEMLKEIVSNMVTGDCNLKIDTKPSVILVIGVNGAGKTTTIGKLAMRLKNEGKSVLLAAADTFRAAAIEQLEVWAERADCPMIKHEQGSDPAAVVFDAIAAGKARGSDVIICDTAGRLQNKKNLMDELAKISRVIAREAQGSDVEILLVLDATTGQNALNQARQFRDAAGLTGIVLTKLDGTAKGGVIVGIIEELDIPVKFVGVGEKIEDLQPFNPDEFAAGLFGE